MDIYFNVKYTNLSNNECVCGWHYYRINCVSIKHLWWSYLTFSAACLHRHSISFFFIVRSSSQDLLYKFLSECIPLRSQEWLLWYYYQLSNSQRAGMSEPPYMCNIGLYLSSNALSSWYKLVWSSKWGCTWFYNCKNSLLGFSSTIKSKSIGYLFKFGW